MTVEMSGMDSLFGNDRIDTMVERLWQVRDWKRDPEKDRAVLDQLVRDFPTLDLMEELSKFNTWILANGNKGMVTTRGRYARLRNWCSGAVRFARTRPTGSQRSGTGRQDRPHPGAGSVGGTPAAASAFGSSSGLVDFQ